MKSFASSRKRYRQPGQAIVFIAVLLLVIIAFVGLSVDTGKAFTAQRTNQAGSNAAALAGMSAYLRGQSDRNVLDAVMRALQANNVDNPIQVRVGTSPVLSPNQTGFRAVYIDENGDFISDVGFYAGGEAVPSRVRFIHVSTTEPVETSFAQIVGRETLTVHADGYASMCVPLTGIYPLTFNIDYMNTAGPGGRPVQLEQIFRVTLDVNGGNLGHLQWFGQQWGSSDQGAAWTGAGTLANRFEEGSAQLNDSDPAVRNRINGLFEVGDWFYAKQGAVEAQEMNTAMAWHRDNGTIIRLPLYSEETDKGGNNWQIKFAALHEFQLIDWQFNQGGGGGFVELRYVGPSRGEACPIPGDPSQQFQTDVYGRIDLAPTWADRITGNYNMDVAVILDVSGSMRCPMDRDCTPTTGASAGNRRLDYALESLRNFIYPTLSQANRSNRVALAVFGNDNSSSRMVNFTSTASSFHSIIGTPNSTRANANTNLVPDGFTPSASGLAQSSSLFSSPMQTRNGLPVRHIVLFITDGLANVREGSTSVNQPLPNANPPCPEGAENLHYSNGAWRYRSTNQVYEVNSNPDLQSSCPTNATSPIGRSVVIAEDLRSRTDVEFFVVGMALGSFSVRDLSLDRIAGDPGRVYDGRTPSAMNGLVSWLNTEISENCRVETGARTAARTARVKLYNSITGEEVAAASTSATGEFVFIDVPAGTYHLRASDLGPSGNGLAFGTDPTRRLYNRMYLNDGFIPFFEVAIPSGLQRYDVTGASTNEYLVLGPGDANGNEIAIC